MKPGPLEIVLIIAVIIAAVVAARIFRPGGTFRWPRPAPSGSTEKPPVKKQEGTRTYFTRIGVALSLVGLILLIAGLSAFQWAFQSYRWSFVLIAIGIIVILVTRRKR